ncbi:adenylate kinase-domain-containing protein [Blyttiomyces helicus]|uniref:Adenylate kinase-domain-containing protein n=1 Tax=Blyttiomyces helicus TaxID=388810 RepID=A0A4P9WEF9_9FUNG|nr:adenylate kinase-domain-containing protein [Blyttiomyces helicus]|eukprot:RKO91109.1 adenylate kinase-domain-containing protein [Blyttiomyces helicus]
MEKRLIKRGETSGRADDNIETIKKRFRTFVDTSMPVIDSYLMQNKCVKISSEPPADEVYDEVRKHFVTELPKSYKNIVFVLGKGTQCTRLAKEFNYSHLSAGDLLRAEVATGSELGQQLDVMMKEGKIVPMEVTLRLLRRAMDECSDGEGFLIDGFPRQLDQAVAFEEQIAKCKFVLYFECTEGLLEKRLLKRGETSGRADDNIETIKKRFRTFIDTSMPVIDSFMGQNKCIKVRTVDGVGVYSGLGLPGNDLTDRFRMRAVQISSEPPVEEVYAEVRQHFVAPVPASYKNIVFVLGKGTQCVRLAKEYNYSHLSAGDLLREEVATGSELGQQLDAMMKEGKIVPMEVTLRLLRKAMEAAPADAQGFLIDGFPRQLDQAVAFEEQIAKCKFVLFFECTEALLEKRLLKRGETSGRADDNIATIKKRFQTFIDTSMPVIDAYIKQGKCIKISSEPPVEEVYAQVKTHFEPQLPKSYKNIVFVLGGPGSAHIGRSSSPGKGTQCVRLAKEFNYTHLSAGDLLREEVATGSDLGKQLDAMMKEGKIVPMEITLRLLKKVMDGSNAANGFLIDGFPRQLDQAVAFEQQIAKCKFVLFFECTEALMEKRLIKRGETSGRADDNIETIKKRFRTFVDTSMPVIESYLTQKKCIKATLAPDSAIFVGPSALIFHVLQLSILIILLLKTGGPGSGKGTQCTRLAKDFNYTHLSAGDLLRAEVATGTDLGKELDAMMKEGKIVPMAMEASDDAEGFLIDGFPRQLDQAVAFEDQVMLAYERSPIREPQELLEKRLLKRGETSGRADDNIETIKKRFRTFIDTSMPVIDSFMEQEKCIKISSEPPVEEVYAEVRKHFVPALPKSYKNIVFVLGGPGSGKGTQCVRLAKDYNYTHLSAGDLLRAEVATGSDLGKQLDAMMKEGKIVPMVSLLIQSIQTSAVSPEEETTLRLLRTAMENSADAEGFLIDGFPRQLDQAIAFEEQVRLFHDCGNIGAPDSFEFGPVDFIRSLPIAHQPFLIHTRLPPVSITQYQIAKCKFVLYFECTEELLESRLLKRGETSGRADDNIETIKKRFRTFIDTSMPVIEAYMEKGKCVKISSEAPIEEVYAQVRQQFDIPNSYRNIVFVLGKGTQCARLAKEFNYTHLSAGDLLREEVATGSDLGKELDAMMKEGKIVPAEVTLRLLQKAMEAGREAEGFLIDGFPRQMDQATAFENQIGKCKFVLFFDCTEALLEKRLIKRGETSGRADDNIETIKKRFRTFVDTSMPVVEAFDAQKKCIKISSEPPVEEVYKQVRSYFI